MQQQAMFAFHRCTGTSLENKEPKEPQTQAITLIRRIGRTNYRVKVHLSKTASETLDDKIFRLIRNETASGKAVFL